MDIEDRREGIGFNLKSVVLTPKGDIPLWCLPSDSRLLYLRDQHHVPLRSPQLTDHVVRYFLYHKILFG
jgi:hypothetical protein